MRTIQRIAKNTGIIIITQAIGYLIGFFYGIYMARYLGASDFGVLSFGLAITAIFSIFTDLGLGPLIVREVARDKSLAGKYLGNAIIIKFILSIIAFVLLVLIINLLNYSEQATKIIYLLGLAMICKTFAGIFDSVAQANEKMEYVSVSQILNNSLMLLGIFLAVGQRLNVVVFAFIYLFVNFVCLMYSVFICLWKFAKPKIEADWNFWKNSLKQSLPFGISSVFVTNFQWISSVMLFSMQGNTVVGWYNAAYRMVLVLLIIPSAFITSIYPVMSRFYINSNGSFKLGLAKSFKYLTILAIPIGIGTTILAPKFISFFYGAEYANSGVPLQILVWSSVFIFMSFAFGNLFNSSNNQIIVTGITGACVLFNIILNLILIPRYSLVGASIAIVATEFLSLILNFMLSYKIGYGIDKKELRDILLKIFGSGLLMGTFIVFFKSLPLLILILLSALIYFIFLYIIKGINKEDIYLIKSLISKKQTLLN